MSAIPPRLARPGFLAGALGWGGGALAGEAPLGANEATADKVGGNSWTFATPCHYRRQTAPISCSAVVATNGNRARGSSALSCKSPKSGIVFRSATWRLKNFSATWAPLIVLRLTPLPFRMADIE